MRRKSAFSCTIMRGGTSKGIFLRAEELPQDPGLRERIILAVFGSPDIRQIDGLGGADSLTSKLALVSAAHEPGRDVDYTFGAVGIDRAFVDYSSNCGNISSAVGPYAIDRGLVKPVAPFTTVRIYNTNTRKMIYAKVPVKGGRVVSEGDYEIAGTPGSGARIELTFMDPAGAVTGRLLPTGRATDEIELAAGERYAVTIVDAGNPTAFVRAEELNLIGDELPAAVDTDRDLRARLDAIRRKVAVLAGIPFSESMPKICFVAPAREYRTAAGRVVGEGEVTLLARVMAMGKMHKAFALTAAVPAAIGAILPGSVVNRAAGGERTAAEHKIIIGHPSGVMDVAVEVRFEKGEPRIVSCTVGRTARKIMEGRVYIPASAYAAAE
ncbi:MAG: 3-methylitaconate isomerase [Deltaproteobacteria bacterium]|nr:3-methylitaconate isomerase [Deltaproteobacteria bacterium]